MNKFQFIKFEKTPNEKHLGIATIKMYDKIIARYKIVPTKDGSSFFPAPASLKIDDKYFPAFSIDSSTEKDELDDMIKCNVKAIMNGVSIPQEAPAPIRAPIPDPRYEQMNYLDTCPF